MTRLRRSALLGLMVTIDLLAAGCGLGRASAAVPASPYSAGRHVVAFPVAGVARAAVVVVPANLTHALPVVFMFHGHGGSGAIAERMVGLQGVWPDAVVVYPDGLVGHKGITDPAGLLPGWQTEVGESGDRDIAFYDTMLATIEANLPVDRQRVYVMGHSNGAAFASLLVSRRGSAIAAVTTISAQPSAALLAAGPARSMFMVMGVADPIVPYAVQKLSVPPAERKLGAEPAPATVTGYLRSEPGRGNLELATYVHPGGHEIPAEVPGLAVAFFKRHTLSAG